MMHNFGKFFKNLGSTFQLIYRYSPKWTTYQIITAAFTGMFPLILIYFIKILIDEVSKGVQQNTQTNFADLLWIIIATGCVFFINSALGTLFNYLKQKNTRVIEDGMFKEIQEKTATLDLEYYENPYYHDIIHRAEQESKYRPAQILNGLVLLSQNLIALLLVGFMLSTFHYLLFLVLVIAVLPGIIVKFKYNEANYKLNQNTTPVQRKIFYFHRILTEKVFTKELRLFGLASFFRPYFQQLRDTIWEKRNRLLIKKTIGEILSHLLAAAAIFGVFAYMTRQAIHSKITIGDLVLYFLVIRRGFTFVKGMMEGLSNIYEQNLFLQNLYEFFNLQPKVKSNGQQKTPFTEPFSIEANNLDFTYPNTDRKVLENINFKIPPGKTVAFVGENGAGKTTLIKLLCRFYDPDNGVIKFNHKPLTSIRQKTVFSSVSVLFQDFILYNLEAGRNIWFGDTKKSYSSENIKKAARYAGIESTIMNLPNQYNTYLGNLFEESAELSLGEWQKLALARAYYRNAGLYILDEPTSSLDPKTEAEVFEKFRQLIEGKTAIIISHRFTTIKMADYIYVIDQHHIVEEGTHNTLIKQNGKYAQMYNKQAQNYL